MKPRRKNTLLDLHRYAVIGAARSGIGASKLLLALGKDVALYDDKSKSDDSAIAELQADGVKMKWGMLTSAEALQSLEGVDVVIASPGLPASYPIRIAAKELGVPLIGEIELAWLASGKSKIVAVTGTKGKTTTTMLTRHVLSGAGFTAVEAGNIGHTFSIAVMEAGDKLDSTIFCVEVSSFQLEDTLEFRPDVAVVTNVSPDHLDRHKNMEEYWSAKQRITAKQTPEDTLIVNQDDAACLRIEATSQARTLRYALERKVERGAWLDADWLVMSDGEVKPKKLVELNRLRLRGMHNAANALAASCAAYAMGAPTKKLGDALVAFRGAPHRLEHIATIRGVEYFNDSKATNIESVRSALQSFHSPIHLIAGGQDKQLPFEPLRETVQERVARAYLIGEAAEKIAAAWDGCVEIARTGTLERALEEASQQAAAGETILLSPGCASFDQFQNAEHRGRSFNEWVARKKSECEGKD